MPSQWQSLTYYRNDDNHPIIFNTSSSTALSIAIFIEVFIELYSLAVYLEGVQLYLVPRRLGGSGGHIVTVFLANPSLLLFTEIRMFIISITNIMKVYTELISRFYWSQCHFTITSLTFSSGHVYVIYSILVLLKVAPFDNFHVFYDIFDKN